MTAAQVVELIAAIVAGVHADDDKWDGYDGSGVHCYERGNAGDCRICAALDDLARLNDG